ncbi:MAG: SCP2 sterol-binding domain-containing protein [Deltaproteobacteria bacterium]|nr:SCP2 sterol-binding domain-containing protein [Deltaproteobacteria bacterium]
MILFSMRFVIWRANRIKEAKEMMKRWNRKVQFDVTGVTPFYVMVQEGRASVVKGRADKSDLVIKGSQNGFRKILKGELKFEEAFLRKQFETVGSIRDAAIFNRIVGSVLESHKRTLPIFRRFFGKLV